VLPPKTAWGTHEDTQGSASARRLGLPLRSGVGWQYGDDTGEYSTAVGTKKALAGVGTVRRQVVAGLFSRVHKNSPIRPRFGRSLHSIYCNQLKNIDLRLPLG
jgi:hypothetical protein